MIKSVSIGTLRQYDKPIRLWWEYCCREKIKVWETPIPDVLKFLTEISKDVKSYSTINTYRAALSFISGNKIGTDSNISRFFKGIAALKPRKYKYDVTWDPKLVLDKLATWYPHEQLSLEVLTKKIVTLLALITAQRVQTLTAIRLQNISIDKEPIRVKITDPIKTTGRSKFQPILEIPKFTEQPQLCAASTLRAYINKTKMLRADTPNF